MPRTKKTPTVTSYYRALQQIVSIQSGVLTGALSHYGERGRNDEQRVREFLEQVLPRRFSIGSGFLVCSKPGVPPSNQTDIVIFDGINNSPLHSERVANVYPVEMVYATVEVKATLTPTRLLEACQAIQKVRELGRHQLYIDYIAMPKDADHPEQLVSVPIPRATTTPPRAFVFAFDQKGIGSIDKLQDALRAAVARTGAHIHGLVVANKDWYVYQEAFADGRLFHPAVGDALMRFVRGMLGSMGSRRVGPAWMNRYLEPEPPQTAQSNTLPPTTQSAARDKGDRFRTARARYRPEKLRLVFVAEAPPASESDRFFYFHDVRNHDALFLNLVRAVYRDVRAVKDVSLIRQRKAELLEAFKRDGLYLIDASDRPMPKGASDAEKIRILVKALPTLRAKVEELSTGDRRLPFVLISGNVNAACRAELERVGANVRNREPIDFPFGNWQARFHKQMSDVLRGKFKPKESGVFR
jgi:Domain of unknown function (DUF6602)